MISLEDRPACVTDPLEFDDRLFAHIHLDNRLIGTNLEGDMLRRTSSYLNKMLEYIGTHDCGIAADKQQRIQETFAKVKIDLDTLGEIDKEIQESIARLKAVGGHPHLYPTTEELDKDYINPIAKTALKKLETQGSVLIPGGWSGDPGHAMCYQLIKNKDGTFTFLVFNTGAGIEHHLQSSQSLDKYIPLMAYKIPAQKNDSNLEAYIQSLLAPRIKPRCDDIKPMPGPDKENHMEKRNREQAERDQWKIEKEYSSQRLYSEVLPNIFCLGAEELDPGQFTNIKTQSQISGTCAMRVMMPLLHTQMKGEAFQEFLYQTRLQSLLDYYRIKKTGNKLGETMVQRLLGSSLSKLARTTKKYMQRTKNGKPIITETQGIATLKLLESIEKDLQAQHKQELETKLQQEEFRSNSPLNDLVVNKIDPYKYRMIPPVISEQDIKIRNDVITARTVPNINDFPNPLDFLQAIHAVSQHNDIHNLSESVLHEIEQSFASFPLEPGAINLYWSKLKPEDAQEAIRILQAIQRIYGKHCARECPYPIPQQRITAYTTQLMASYIINQYYQQQLANPIPQFLPESFLLGDIESVSLDPKWDKRITELNTLTLEIHKESKNKRLKDIDKKNLDEKEQAEALKIEDRIDFLDHEFLTKFIDSKTLEELNTLESHHESVNSLENARINLYYLMKSSEAPKTDSLRKVIDQYKMMLEFETLCYESEVFGEGTYSYFSNISTVKGTEAKKITDFLEIQKKGESSTEERTLHKSKLRFTHKPGWPYKLTHTSVRDFLDLNKEIVVDQILFLDPKERWHRADGTYTVQQSNMRLIHALLTANPDLPMGFPIRSLSYISQMPNECRVVATKDFFESNLELLNDQVYKQEGQERRLFGKDFQTFFLANLFTPELLDKELTRNPGFANDLIKLIDMGFKYHIQGSEVSQGGVFFFQVTYHLLKYLKNHKKSAEFSQAIQWLENKDKLLTENITTYKNKLSSQPSELISKTYNDLLHVNLLRHTISADKKISRSDMENLFRSLLHYNLERSKGDKNQYFYRDMLTGKAIIQPILKAQFQSLENTEQKKLVRSLLQDIIIPNLVPNDKYTIKLDYPAVQIQHGEGLPILVDLSRGIIESRGKRLGKLPSSVYSNEFIKLFGSASIKGEIMEDSEKTICSFTRRIKSEKEKAPSRLEDGTEKDIYSERRYRVTFDKAAQKTFIEMQHNNKWYTLWNRDYPIVPGTHNLDNDRIWWCEANVSIDEASYLCTDLKGNHLYRVEMPQDKAVLDLVRVGKPNDWYGNVRETSYRCLETNAAGDITGRTLVNRFATQGFGKDIYSFFSRFEDPEFIEVWQKNTDLTAADLEVKMPRYGLEWLGKVNPENKQMEYFLKDKPEYRLVLSNKPLIPGFNHHLMMENLKTGEIIAVVPNQEFYVSESASKEMNQDGEYIMLSFDTSNIVPPRILQTEKIKATKPGMSASDENWSWQQRNSQKYRTFKIKDSGISADSVEDYLYLAYLYLAKHEPLKAMEALKKCHQIGGLKGREEEALLIKRLMTEVPNQDGRKESLKDRRGAITMEPDTIAVRLYAGLLLSERKVTSFNKPLIKESSKISEQGQNGYAASAKALSERANTFYTTELDKTLEQVYSNYQAIRDNISFEARLPPVQELTLLENVYPPGSKIPITIQNRLRDLELGLLSQEKDMLHKKKIQGVLAEPKQQRLSEIQTKLKSKAKKLEKHQKLITELVQIPPLNIKTIGSLASKLLYSSDSCKKGKLIHISSYSPVSIQHLKLEDLIYSFNVFYNFARTASKDNKEQIENFKIMLEGILKGELRNGNGLNERAQLCSIFYYVLDHQEAAWPEYNFHAQGNQTPLNTIAELCEKINASSAKKISISRISETPAVQAPRKGVSAKRLEKKEQREAATIVPELPAFLLPASNDGMDYNLAQEFSIKALSEQLAGIAVTLIDIPDIFQQEEQKKQIERQKIEHELKSIDESLSDPNLKTEQPAKYKNLTRAKKQLETDYNRVREDSFLTAQKTKFLQDMKRGREINLEKKSIQEIYRQHLIADTPSKVAELESSRKNLKSNIETENNELEDLQAAILALADTALHGEKATATTRAELVGKQIKKPNFQELIGLYLQGNPALFQKRTKLDAKSIEALYQQIHLYLLKKTANQHRERIAKIFSKLDAAEKGSAEYDSYITQLGDQITAKRSYNPQEHPEMLVFEYLEDLMIRPEQSKIIERLLKHKGEGFSNEIVQLIMGGGKSKVLLPLLALKKATGTNLSMIVVPASLFETNVADLQATSQRLFGKTGHKFVFDRDTIDGKVCTARNLELFYKKISEKIRLNQDFIITTAESIQSLQLKYLELLGKESEATDQKHDPNLPPPKPISEEEKKQIEYLEKILKLVKTEGDVLIDECDTVLDIKRELNYTQGGADGIPEKTLVTIQQLYNLFSSTVIHLSAEQRCTLQDIMLGSVVISKEEIWDQAFQALASQLIINKESPLFNIANGLTESQHQDLIDYLLNEAEEIPSFVLEGRSDEQRSLIGLMKGEIELLRTCLKRKPNEHYGFPVSAEYAGSKELAIPYLANNTPNERAQFGSVLEIINYTIQLQNQKETLSMDIILEFIDDFMVKARDQVAKSYGQIEFSNTIAAKEFQEKTGIALKSINLENLEEMKTHQFNISKNKLAKDYMILKYVLPKIRQYPYILRSNPINHVGQYRSAQAMSGTPWDKKCYHPSFDKADEKEELEDEALSLGTDGQTIDLLRQKDPAIRICADKTPKSIIHQRIIEHPESNRIHAFMDIGALFKGLSNVAVARELANALCKRKSNAIRHILYFDANNTLCALPFESSGQPPYNAVIANPISIGSTDPNIIAEKIGSTADKFFDQCFTYYDQRHTTGTDIKQSIDSIGIATVDIDTKARDLWQGVMRLRQFALKQTVEIVIPNEVAATIPEKKQWQVDDVIKLVQRNQDQVLGERHLRAAIDKMNDVVRQRLLDTIYNAQDVNEKLRLRKLFSEVFITETGTDYFQKFKDCEKWLDKETILSQHAKDCYERYLSLMRLASPIADIAATKAVKDALDFIKQKAIKNCLAFYKQVPKTDQEQMVEASRLKETLKENKNEREQEQEIYPRHAGNPNPIKSWSKLKIFPKQLVSGRMEEPLGTPGEETGKITREYIEIGSLQDMVDSASPSENWTFSPNIFVSENYRKTLYHHYNTMDQFIKPVNFFIAIQEPGTNALKTMLITQEEATEFMQYLDTNRDDLIKQGYGIWIKSPHNTLLAGTSPEITHKEYSEVLEQIQFFNGDLDMLSEDMHLNWLIERNTEKMDFLKNVILKNHPEKRKFLARFEELKETYFKKLSQDSKVTSQQLFNAVKDQDLKVLEALLQELNRIPNPKVQHLILNQNDNETGVSLLSTAIKLGNADLVTRLLQEKQLTENPTLEESALRTAIKHFKPEIFQAVAYDKRMLPKKNDQKYWSDLFDQVFSGFLMTKDLGMLTDFINTMASHLEDYTITNIIKSKFKIIDGFSTEQITALLSLIEKSTKSMTIWQEYIQHRTVAFPEEGDKLFKLLHEWHDTPPTPDLGFYFKNKYSYDYTTFLRDSFGTQNQAFLTALIQDKAFMPPIEDIQTWFHLLDALKYSSHLTALETLIKTINSQFPLHEKTKILSYVLVNPSAHHAEREHTLDLHRIINAVFQQHNPAKEDIERMTIILKIYPASEDKAGWKHIIDTLPKQKPEMRLQFFEALLARPFTEIEAPVKDILEKFANENQFETLHSLMALLTKHGHVKSLSDSKFLATNEKLLQKAVASKRWEQVEQYLQSGMSLKSAAAAGELMTWAVANKKTELVKVAIAEGASPNQLDTTGQPILITAIQNNDSAVTSILLSANADIHLQNKTGDTAFTVAFKPEHVTMGQILLQKFGDPAYEQYNGDVLQYANSTLSSGNYTSFKILNDLKLIGFTQIRSLFSGALAAGSVNALKFLLETYQPYLQSIINPVVQQQGWGWGIQNETPKTPLDDAFKAQNEALILLLIQYGAKLSTEHLFQAIEMGSSALVKAILESGQNIAVDATSNSYTADNYYLAATPLYLALKQGKEEIAMLLLNAGANPNPIATHDYYRDYIKESFLHKAILDGNINLAKLLIAKGADPNFKTAEGQSPFSLALEKDNKELIAALSAAPAMNIANCWSEMLNAAENKRDDLVKIIAEGQKIDLNDPWIQLMIAAAAGNFTAFRAALQSNKLPLDQFVNKSDPAGSTALHWAASIGNAGQIDIVQVLCKMPEININQQNNFGWTALMYAAAYGKERVATLLIADRNIDLELRDTSGKTALELILNAATVSPEFEKIAIALVQKGAIFPVTAVFDAIRLGYPALVKALLENKADANQLNSVNQTPLWAALESGNVEIVQLLLNAGADPNIIKKPVEVYVPSGLVLDSDPYADPFALPSYGDPGALPPTQDDEEPPVRRSRAADGSAASREFSADLQPDPKDTLVMLAIRQGKIDIAKILVQKGLDFTAVNGRGETALDICRKLKQDELAILIQEATAKQAVTRSVALNTPDEDQRIKRPDSDRGSER